MRSKGPAVTEVAALAIVLPSLAIHAGCGAKGDIVQ
jgi:hypothetical protein